MHYLPPGVFYDFLGSHNKVRQREFRTMALCNCPRLLSSDLPFPPAQTSSSIVFAHRRAGCPHRPGKYGPVDTESFAPIILNKVSESLVKLLCDYCGGAVNEFRDLISLRIVDIRPDPTRRDKTELQKRTFEPIYRNRIDRKSVV